MSYVDGFVLPVPEKNIEAYRKMAQTAGEVWMEYGALSYKECILDNTQWGEDGNCMKSIFPQIAGVKEGETVIFAFIVYASREARDAINAKVMEDPRIKDSCGGDNMPFDHTRMAWGGFSPIIDM